MPEFEEQLRTRLEEAQRQVSRLTHELEALQKAQSAAQKEVATWEEALLAERRSRGEAGAQVSGDMLQSSLARLSLGDATLELLRRVGAPMHVKDILRELRRYSYPIASKNPIAAIVTTLTRRKQFKRVGPNTFGLVEGDEDIPQP